MARKFLKAPPAPEPPLNIAVLHEGLAMNWEDRIVADPKVLVGKAVIRGTRIAVEFLLELLALGWSHAEILENYPHLTEDDIQAALRYAVELVRQERVFPLAS